MKFSVVLAALAATVASASLRICHHNDFHARYTQQTSSDAPCLDADAAAGRCYSAIGRIAQAMGTGACDLRIHAGDFVQGSVYDTVFGTTMAVAAYKSVQYDIAVLGNHEFDHGVDPVYDTIMQTTPKLSWIGSNVRFANAPAGLNITSALNARGICWVSALTQDTFVTSSPGPNVMIDNVTSSIKRAISTGCNQTKNVIAITHIGFSEDIDLCLAVPELDLVIGGHSHTPLDDGQYPRKVVRPDGSVCRVVQTYAYGRVLGVLDVDFSANGTLLISGDAYVPMDGRIPLDPGTDRMVDYFRKEIGSAIKRVVGRVTATVDGSRASCRTKECQMGDLVCDALLAKAGPKQGAQICITNGGGIRASFDAGDVTVEAVVNVLPFSNYHVVFQVPGSTIINALENGYSAVGNDAISGRFPQIAGMKVKANYAAPVGSRVNSITIGNAPLVASQMYTVVTNDYMWKGGDGYQWAGLTNIQSSGQAMDTTVEEYLTAHNPYTPFTDGREP